MLGPDNWGIPGEDGAKGEKGATGIPNTETGVPGADGLKGSTGDPGGSSYTVYIFFLILQNEIISNLRALSKIETLLFFFFLGDQGKLGPQGNQGPPGAQGIPGRKGLSGDIGLPGQKGLPGKVLNILDHNNSTEGVSTLH